MRLDFSRQIFENSLISSFIKIRPVGAELFHADARTDGHNEANFAYALKNGCINPLHILSGFQYTIAVADF